MTQKLIASFLILFLLVAQTPYESCGLGWISCCCDPAEEIVEVETESCCSSHSEELPLPVEDKEKDPCQCEINDQEPVNDNIENIVPSSQTQPEIALNRSDIEFAVPKINVICTIFTTGPPTPKQQLYILYQHLLL